jgi:hypothetical protein
MCEFADSPLPLKLTATLPNGPNKPNSAQTLLQFVVEPRLNASKQRSGHLWHHFFRRVYQIR